MIIFGSKHHNTEELTTISLVISLIKTISMRQYALCDNKCHSVSTINDSDDNNQRQNVLESSDQLYIINLQQIVMQDK